MAAESIPVALDVAVLRRGYRRSSRLSDYWILTKPEMNFLIAITTGIAFASVHAHPSCFSPGLLLVPATFVYDAWQEMTAVLMLSSGSGAITALAAIGGSLVGALGSSASTWIIQRHQDRRDLLARKIVRRETLYSDFISESARLLVDAAEHSVGDPHNLIPVYALVSRIRLGSSPDVLNAAEEVVKHIIGNYRKPNLTAEQIESVAVSGEDPLRNFSDICRIELEGMQRQI